MATPEPTTAAVAAFTPGERDYIRHELDRFFSTLPSVADGSSSGRGAAGRRRAWLRFGR